MTKEANDEAWALADYYECSGVEELTHDTVEEALEAYLDVDMSPGCDAEKVILANGDVTVKAYTRKVVDPGQAKRWAEHFADFLNEAWSDEEYGNPEDYAVGPGTAEFVKEVIPVIEAAIARIDVWQCEKVAEKVFPVEEVLAIMKKECPDWFEKEST